MKPLTQWCYVALAVLSISLGGIAVVHGQMKAGEAAPLFVLKSSQGKSFELASMQEQPMLILYFFDVASRPSQEGLLSLDKLAKKYKDAELAVWGITRSDAGQVSQFLSQTQLGFPVLIDDGKVADQYAARIILPTACIVGPDLKLLDYFQGGGKTTESLLVTLAERKLQSRQTNIAKALSNEVTQKDPGNVRAQSVQGYAELKEGDLKAAENTFSSMSQKKGDAEIVGKEGLSQVYAQKGQPDKAMTMAREVEGKAGDRAYSHVVKGDLLYSQNKPKEAEAEYRKAVEKSGGNPSHRATAYNQLGRIYAARGDYSKSLGMYDQAVSLDPFYVEATSNKGMTYERQGQWDQALASYRKAQTIDHADPFAATLAANANKMILMEKDPDRRRQIESQIDTYAQNYKDGVTAATEQTQDAWTSGEAIQIMLLEPVETGGLSIRDGFPRVLTLHLADQLNTSGRLGVVEPVVLERVIQKVGLSHTDLADRDISLKLARACGAKLIAKGTLYQAARYDHQPGVQGDQPAIRLGSHFGQGHALVESRNAAGHHGRVPAAGLCGAGERPRGVDEPGKQARRGGRRPLRCGRRQTGG
ncbi:MAG: tetratricopeptide repeat protein [Desulfobacterales bacterium]|nr:tetratricopeptide repeat protein [Desulfobacterales bacterium]